MSKIIVAAVAVAALVGIAAPADAATSDRMSICNKFSC